MEIDCMKFFWAIYNLSNFQTETDHADYSAALQE